MKIIGQVVDFNYNVPLKLRFPEVISNPILAPELAGVIVYNTVAKVPYLWDGTDWLDLAQTAGGGGHTVASYRSSFESSDTKVYAGYLFDGTITITRTKDGVLETATGLTNLETDWTNRLTLTYV